MSARPIPVPKTVPKTERFLPITHKHLCEMLSFARGEAMSKLILYLLSEANYRSKDSDHTLSVSYAGVDAIVGERGSYDGHSGLLRTQAMADQFNCGRHTVNAVIRQLLSMKAFERLDADTAKEAGIVTEQEAEVGWDGYTYRALLENWSEAAELARDAWKAECDAAEQAAADKKNAKTGPKTPEPVIAITAQPLAMGPGHTARVDLEPAAREAYRSVVSIQCKSDLTDTIILNQSVQGGVLTIEARLASVPGKCIYRPAQPVDGEKVIRDIRKVLKPEFKHFKIPGPSEMTISRIAGVLDGCPVIGESGVTFERMVHTRMQSPPKKVLPGLFVHIAQDAHDTWLEALQDEDGDLNDAVQVAEVRRMDEIAYLRELIADPSETAETKRETRAALARLEAQTTAEYCRFMIDRLSEKDPAMEAFRKVIAAAR